MIIKAKDLNPLPSDSENKSKLTRNFGADITTGNVKIIQSLLNY